jgi:hypothetical protein
MLAECRGDESQPEFGAWADWLGAATMKATIQ